MDAPDRELNAIEQAIVRALVPLLVRRILADAEATNEAPDVHAMPVNVQPRVQP